MQTKLVLILNWNSWIRTAWLNWIAWNRTVFTIKLYLHLNCVPMQNWIAWNRTIFIKMDLALKTNIGWYAIKPKQPTQRNRELRIILVWTPYTHTHTLTHTHIHIYIYIYSIANFCNVTINCVYQPSTDWQQNVSCSLHLVTK